MARQPDQAISPGVRPIGGGQNDAHIEAIMAMLPPGLPRCRKRYEQPPSEVFTVAVEYRKLHQELTPRLAETLAARAYWESIE